MFEVIAKLVAEGYRIVSSGKNRVVVKKGSGSATVINFDDGILIVPDSAGAEDKKIAENLKHELLALGKKTVTYDEWIR